MSNIINFQQYRASKDEDRLVSIVRAFIPWKPVKIDSSWRFGSTNGQGKAASGSVQVYSGEFGNAPQERQKPESHIK